MQKCSWKNNKKDKIRENYGKIEKLDWVKVQLTRCCNLKWSFCSQADFRDASTIDADLFIKNVLEVAKPRFLIFTGGEPLAKYDTLKNC